MRTHKQSIMNDEIWLLLDSRGMGGIEAHVLYLAQGLKKRGYNARIIFYKDYGVHPLEELLQENRINYSKLGGHFGHLKSRIKQDRPALIHTHGYKAGILGRIAGYLCHVSVLSTYHSGDLGKGKVRLYSWLDSLTGFLAEERISVSKEISNRLPCSSRHMNNFVPLPQITRIDVKKKKRLTVGFVGRLSKEKGPDLFCALAWKSPDIDFIAFGEGTMRTLLQWRYGGRVKFHGHVQNMEERWKDIDLLCIPSRHEGLPLVALEAMARGIPVLASDVGDLPVLIEHGENGWIAPSEDVDGMADILKTWATSSIQSRRCMSFAAHSTVEEHYSADIIVLDILDVYQCALGEHKIQPHLSVGHA